MRTHDEALDPAVAAELEALEVALAGLPEADPELAALVRDVRADPPAPRAAFLADLDARAAAGFPRERRAAWLPRTLALPRPRLLAPAAGAVATVLAGVAVVGLTRGGDAPRPTAGQPTVEIAKSAPAAPAAGGGAGAQGNAGAPADAGAAPPATTFATPGSGGAVPERQRKVERTTQLALRTSAGRLQSVADRIVAVTQAAGGVVTQSQVDATDRGGSASFTLRVPSRGLQDTVKRLSALAHVSSLSQSTTDITDAFASAQSRLGDARRERAALLRALGRATTASEIASLKARLGDNRTAIARAQTDVAATARRADLATVQVTLEARGREPQSGGSGGGWSPADAARDALRVLEVAAGVLLVGAAVGVPLSLLGALAVLAARGLRRRRREQALDPA